MKKESKQVLVLSGVIWILANLHHPVTPSYFTELNLPDHVFGTSYAAMVFAMFLTGPIWGSIGDNGRRVQSLRIVTLFYGIFQIGFSYMTSLTGIILFRALSGTMSSGFHVGLMSLLVDVTDGKDRKRIMANYSAIMGVAGAVGFLLGGFIGYLPSKYVFIIQGSGMILVSFLIGIFIKEPNMERRKEKGQKINFVWDIFKDASRSREVFTFWIKIFLAISFFIGIAYSGFNNAFNYYLKAELGMKPIFNGIWKAVNGIVGLILNLTLSIWIIEKTDTKKSIVSLIGLTALTTFLSFINTSALGFFIFSFLFFNLYTVQLPVLQGFAVEDQVKDVGLMSGMYNAIRSLGEMIGSTVAGFTYEISSKMPFLISSIALVIAFGLGLYHLTRKDRLGIEEGL